MANEQQEIQMPSPAPDVREAMIAAWLKSPGDVVAAGEVIAEAQTDKVNVEIPAPAAGTLDVLLVAEGAVVPVGTPIALLRLSSPGDEPGRRLAGDR